MSQSSRSDGLWRHPDFLKLWAGHTVSLAGSLISRFALPLVAILSLNASPGEVALIRMADAIPGVVLGLVAGVWVDRVRRRPLMIWADIGRAVLLAWIPLAAIFGLLGIWQLFAVVMAAGTLTALFEIANRSYLPTLIRREQLVEGNSKLSASGIGGRGGRVRICRAAGAAADRTRSHAPGRPVVRTLGGLPGLYPRIRAAAVR